MARTSPAERIRSFWQSLKGGELRRLLPRLRPHRRALAAATVMLVGGAAVALAFPRVVGVLLDSAFVAGSRERLDRTVLLLAVLIVVQAVLVFGETYLLSATGERVVGTLRRDLFEKLLGFPPAFFADRRTGELTSRLGADVQALQGVLSTNLTQMASEAIALVGAVAMLVVTHARLASVTLFVVPVVVGTVFLFSSRFRRVSLGVVDQVADATAIAEEAFSQVRVVQSFTGEPHEARRYGERIAQSVQAALRRAATRGAFFAAVTLATYGGAVLVLWLGGRMVLAGELTAGTLVSFLLYAWMAAGSVGSLGHLWSQYQEATGAAARVFEILEARPNLRDPDAPVPLPRPVRGEVAFHNVWFRYERPAELPFLPPAPTAVPGFWGGTTLPRDLEAAKAEADAAPPEWTLRGITLRIAPGETVALVGPSGAGKTTLAALIPRFGDPQEGTVTLDGIDVARLRLAELRGAVGVVPQETLLFSGTVRENIAYGRPGATDAEVEAAARAAHAYEFVRRLPEGYDTRVGERGVKLSGGQRQRIAIARAILKDPAVLVLDEATSSLDTESEALIEDALNQLLVGRTTLIIAHRLSTVRRADRLLVLDRGMVVEEGTHAGLLAKGGVYARLYARQFRDDDDPRQATELAAV